MLNFATSNSFSVLGSGVISRLLSKSVDLPTMPHVGRIISDNPDSTPMRPRKAKSVDVIYPTTVWIFFLFAHQICR